MEGVLLILDLTGQTIAQLQRENAALREENAALREQLEADQRGGE